MVEEKKRSASCYRGLRTGGVRRATCRAPEGEQLQSQRRQTMSEVITSFVGLDVHKDCIAVGLAPEGREEPRFLGTVAALSKTLSRLGAPKGLKIVYEAGPCGYTLARQLQEHGYACEAIAPAKIKHAPGDRIKTDRRDALLLARAGELVRVTIPDERDEALRDLSRSRVIGTRARVPGRRRMSATWRRSLSASLHKTSPLPSIVSRCVTRTSGWNVWQGRCAPNSSIGACGPRLRR